MTNLQYRQQKIQEKRKQTPWRQFVKEIASWTSLSFYRNKTYVSRFPATERSPNIVDQKQFVWNNVKERWWEMIVNFFDNLLVLFRQTELPNLMHFQWVENADYGDTIVGSNNAYMSKIITFWSNNVLYSFNVKDNNQHILNSHNVFDNSANVYWSQNIERWYHIFYSQNCINSSDIWFSSNIIWCNECVWCSNIENMSYCINNQQYSKEVYYQKKEEVLLHKEMFYLPNDRIPSLFVWSTRAGWWWLLLNCHDVENAYNCFNVFSWRNLIDNSASDPLTNAYDVVFAWRSEHFYGVWDSGGFSSHVYSSYNIWRSSYIFYSYYLENCSYCLWCVWLKNKQFCILNTQYSKEERLVQACEILESLEKDGSLWSFLPAEMNPFFFNETIGYSIDPSFTKTEVLQDWYMRRDEEVSVDIPSWVEVLWIHQLDNYQGRMVNGEFVPLSRWDAAALQHSNDIAWHIDPAILKKVIKDEEGNVYRVIKMEYDFLVKYGLPLPRKHWLTRLKEHFVLK